MSAEALENDPEIAAGDVLLRRVPNAPMMVATESDGRKRPSSAALDLRDDETYCSVDDQKRLRDPSDPFITCEGHPSNWGLAWFMAGQARMENRHLVVGDYDHETNPAHTKVIPTAISRSAQKRNFSELAKCSQFLREPIMDTAVS